MVLVTTEPQARPEYNVSEVMLVLQSLPGIALLYFKLIYTIFSYIRFREDAPTGSVYYRSKAVIRPNCRQNIERVPTLWTRSTATLDRMILHLTSSRGIKSDFISRCTMNYLAHSQLTFRIIQHHAPSKREMRTGSHYSYQDGRGNNS